MNLNDLQREAWDTAESSGFHDAQEALPPHMQAVYLRLLLTIGELSEAAEELRAGHEPGEIYYEHKVMEGRPDQRIVKNDKPWALIDRDFPGEDRTAYSFFSEADKPEMLGTKNQILRPGKPCGFDIELADALIRLADLAEDAGVDLTAATQMKAAYNKTREHMHGKTA